MTNSTGSWAGRSYTTTADLSLLADRNADMEHIHHSLLSIAMNQYSSHIVTFLFNQNSSVYFQPGAAGFSYVN